MRVIKVPVLLVRWKREIPIKCEGPKKKRSSREMNSVIWKSYIYTPSIRTWKG